MIAVFGSVLIAAGETRGQCACAPQFINITARAEFNLAYAVFVGKVVAVKKTSRNNNDQYVESVTFEVTRAWKHDLNSNLTITDTPHSCVSGFEENEEYIVYLYKHEDGTLSNQCCCTRTSLLKNASDDVKTFADDPPAKILRAPNL